MITRIQHDFNFPICPFFEVDTIKLSYIEKEIENDLDELDKIRKVAKEFANSFVPPLCSESYSLSDIDKEHSEIVKKGVVTGEELSVLFHYANENSYALPPINIVGTNSIEAYIQFNLQTDNLLNVLAEAIKKNRKISSDRFEEIIKLKRQILLKRRQYTNLLKRIGRGFIVKKLNFKIFNLISMIVPPKLFYNYKNDDTDANGLKISPISLSVI